jgi:hypothetical protein
MVPERCVALIPSAMRQNQRRNERTTCETRGFKLVSHGAVKKSKKHD